MRLTYGGIEAGGTKWVCGIGTGPDDLRELATFPTTTPVETLERAAGFFAQNGGISAVGVGSFGPIDLRLGRITTTPKPGWAGTDVVSALERALEVPVAFDTDVNAAALGEGRWGAAVGLETFCYITVGTGIGGGIMAGGRLLHGLLHPEVGHMLIPHDRVRDPFAARARIYKLPVAIVCDALKIAYASEGRGQYKDVFFLVRNLRKFLNLQIRLGGWLGMRGVRPSLRALRSYWQSGER